VKFLRFTLPVLVLAGTLSFFFQNCGSSKSSAAKGENEKSGPDSNPPTLMFVEKPDDFSPTSEAIFQLVANDSQSGIKEIQMKLDDEDWSPSGNVVHFEPNELSQGVHRAMFRAVDKKNNFSTVLVHTWTIDDKAPVITFTNDIPQVITLSKSATFVIKVTDASSQAQVTSCHLDGVAVNCSSGTYSVSNLAIGQHVFRVAARDQADNPVVKQHVWAVVTDVNSVPAPKFLAPLPKTFEAGTQITLKIEALDVTGIPNSGLTCTFDGAAYPCKANVAFKVDTPAVKAYNFTARLRLNGNLSAPATVTWTIDRTAPVVTFVAPTVKVQKTNNVKIKFNASDNSNSTLTLACKLDGTVYTPCAPGVELEARNLAVGNHAFEVEAKDIAGNVTKKAVTWSNPSCNKNELRFDWPLPGNEGMHWMVMSYFDINRTAGYSKDFGNAQDDDSRADDNHSGITITTGDLPSTNSGYAKIYAAAGGTVIAIRKDQPDNVLYVGDSLSACREGSNESNYVRIQHANGYQSIYHYMKKNSTPLKVGDVIADGTFIGILGASYCGAFPRLYFQVNNCDDEPIDPVSNNMMFNKPSHVVPIKLLNFVMHDGSLDRNNVTHWRKMFQTPTPKASFKINTYQTFSAFLSGGFSDEYIRIQLFKPTVKDPVVDKYYRKTTSSGKIMVEKSPKLDKDGTWKWKFSRWHMRQGKLVEIETIHQNSFPVTK